MVKAGRSIRSTVATRVAGAVVRLPRLGGQGVLVPGSFVVTAAHCIGWTADGGMVHGDHEAEEITTASGRTLKAQALAVEPVKDLAVLGALDDQVFPDEAEAFEEFCETIAPVPLAIEEFDLFARFPAYVFTHNKGVIPVRAGQWAPGAANLSIEADQPIDRGTSGGPVVTSAGKLLGVVSWSGGVPGETACSGSIARVHFAAPVWLVRQMVPRATQEKLNAALPPGRHGGSSRTVGGLWRPR